MNTTKLHYTGTVKLSLKLSNGDIITLKRHNNGLPDLMKVICKFLSGNGDNYADVPKYIDLRKESAEGTFNSHLKSMCVITGSNYSNLSGNWVTTLTASIPYEQLNEPISETDKTNYRLYLISGEDKSSNTQELAYLDISAEELSRISAGTMGIIEWILTISN